MANLEIPRISRSARNAISSALRSWGSLHGLARGGEPKVTSFTVPKFQATMWKWEARYPLPSEDNSKLYVDILNDNVNRYQEATKFFNAHAASKRKDGVLTYEEQAAQSGAEDFSRWMLDTRSPLEITPLKLSPMADNLFFIDSHLGFSPTIRPRDPSIGINTIWDALGKSYPRLATELMLAKLVATLPLDDKITDGAKNYVEKTIFFQVYTEAVFGS